ncbi:cyclic nucleotide-binding domain-containing protein [Rhodoplanes serenus]|jgi:CRP-like cAMP-binding protein|uniref:Cyclic AMP receptor protein n=1 Tax=Rhodoplanes serenus TaxID=200615 RepID=A0A327KGS9_9BRAD|nr:Crp/Fnr family transcriptional regulator [Rhodoplanes serenus]MBI5112756.1 Crp/Fnr family transcriptional regulator [Rhodovulum sp.]MTW18839.1 cyclic nucleotide-binding domain-containing protein [Rhodoplanes serenus]RAI36582.1 Crp/Fnr family transcriptional regulator [Rhodoplanes serenus]VCU08973.1 Cyclic AMP receptor protein [Rhodoplanes serenus]
MATVDPTLVAGVPLFAGMSVQEREALLREAQAVRFPKGATVFQQDTDAHSFFVLLHGRLRVFKLTPNGQQVVVRFVAPGEVFGVAAAIGRTTYPGTAAAVVDSVALQWPSASWSRLVAAHPALALNTLHTVGGRIQEMHTRVVEMSTEQVERRVAHALLRLAHQAGRKVETGVRIDFPISRQDIAEMTGTTLHTVSRIISAWEERGLVESGRQKITVREPHKLMLLADGADE